ncbi:glycosyltransferase [Planococcus liqunii]|uniref:glycosyltransferase n=1 Tax=Planococcus liqunii TaxID=3058394 RepID=UPI00261CD5BC|nr:glycosyltransferase [Planococcus sp. N056]WKA50212.1 glycosyltransferase [Planococcus sp. N056]
MKKNVLFLINSLSVGGAEKVLINLLNNIDYEKFNVSLITVFSSNVLADELSNRIDYRQLFTFKNKYINGLLYKVLSKIFSSKMLYKFFIKDTYDIEVAFLEGLPTKIISGSNQNQSRRIAWVHTDLSKYLDSDYCFTNIEEQKFCYEQFDEIICVSEGTKRGFEKRFKINKIPRVCINPIDSESIQKLGSLNKNNNLVKMNEETFYYIAVGRLVKQKGFDLLIRSMHLLNADDQCKNFKLIIIGEGPERKFLAELINELNLNNAVQLLGYIKNPYPYIKNADSLVVSSKVEGYCSVIVEAFVLDTPVIAAKAVGVGEVIKNGEFGLYVENDEIALYEGMKKLLLDKSLLNHYKKQAEIKKQEYVFKQSINRMERILIGK